MNILNRFTTAFISAFLMTFFISNLSAQNWTQVGADINGIGDYNYVSSIDLSADGSRLVIGENSHSGGGFNSNGRVRVFEYDGTSWNVLGAELLGDASGNGFGMWVRMTPDGNTIVCGESRADDNGLQSGKVKVYEWDGSSWQMKGNPIVGNTDSEFGTSVDINETGTRIIVGAPHPSDTDMSNSPGEAHVYRWNGTNWEEIGGGFYSKSSSDLFGSNVSMNLEGDVVAICARKFNTNTGMVRVYEWNGTAWYVRGADFTGTNTEEFYGTSVALNGDGTTVAIGAAFKDNDNGQVEVYNWDGSNWNLKGTPFLGSNAEWLGHAVDLSDNGNVLAMGAPWYDGGFMDSGTNRCYLWNGNSWMQIGNEINGDAAYNYCGAFDVSINNSGAYMAVMSYGNDDGGEDAGQVRVFSSPKLEVADAEDQTQFGLYPNPVSNNLTIDSNVDQDIVRVEITNLQGQVLINELLTIQKLDVSVLRAGRYFIRLISTSGQTYTKSFVKLP